MVAGSVAFYYGWHWSNATVPAKDRIGFSKIHKLKAWFPSELELGLFRDWPFKEMAKIKWYPVGPKFNISPVFIKEQDTPVWVCLLLPPSFPPSLLPCPHTSHTDSAMYRHGVKTDIHKLGRWPTRNCCGSGVIQRFSNLTQVLVLVLI